MAQLCALCGKAQFDNVLGYARLRICSGWLCLMAVPNQLGVIRLGVIMSRKRAKSAALRNALRRQVRETLRQHLAAGTGYDLVLLARSPAPLASDTTAAQNREHLCNEIHTLTKRVIGALETEDCRPLGSRRQPRRARSQQQAQQSRQQAQKKPASAATTSAVAHFGSAELPALH